MHLAGTYTGSIIPGVASEDDVSAIARTRPYMMYGWGSDQNKQAADLLAQRNVDPTGFSSRSLLRQVLQ